jgi:Zn-dependent protease
MLPTNEGSFRLFRVAGIDVFLHWSWFLIAAYEIQSRSRSYGSFVWNVAEYVSLFGIVLLHEFGHSFACRQVGGQADRIVLWPLGGIAFVDPPQRPGATLWSIAAGPLVNVALAPLLIGGVVALRLSGLATTMPDLTALVTTIAIINATVLVFNLLPVYPLDGGQILRSLLWFVMGRATSLTVATVVGFIGVAGLAFFALVQRNPWIGVIAAFAGYNCWQSFRFSRRLAAFARLPRHNGYVCPSCGSAPPIGVFWGCGECGTKFDTFETHATCPSCRARFSHTVCFDCGRHAPIEEWARSAA